MIKVAKPFVGDEEVEAVREVLLSGNYVSGSKVAEFEARFAEFVGCRHAVAVNSGTAALHVILASLGIGPCDEVIVPALTFFSTVSCVLHQNAVPVFADINPHSYCLDPKDVAQKITQRTRAIIAVHLFGQAADMDGIGALAKASGVALIEDCAQAHGTRYNGRVVGSIGTVGAFSFFATKHITTGEGGMITTNDPGLADVARQVRNHGMSDRDTHAILGYNYRMNEMAAAIGLVQLGRLPELNRKRIRNSLYLIERLQGLPWLSPPVLLPEVEHTFFWAPFLVDEEALGFSTQELVQRLRQEGVEVRHRYQAPLYRQPILVGRKGYGTSVLCPYACPLCEEGGVDYSEIYLPNVERIAGRLIGLPNHPGLDTADLDEVVRVVRNIAVGKGSS